MSPHEKEEVKKQRTLTCTWDEDSGCLNCSIQGKLDCKWQKSLLLRFYKGVLPAMFFGGIGLLLVGMFVNWIPLFIYFIFWIFFFGFFEIRVLCSHCPYYAKDGFILRCLANHGTIKLWKYRPEPMNAFEKVGFLAGALFFILFPVFTELFGTASLISQSELSSIEEIVLIILIALSMMSFVSGIYFFAFLQIKICPFCINFSCPLNKVSKEYIDSYLIKNPIMRKAWEKSGYKLG